MSTPPPFGDPTQVRRENSSAVGKGVAFGCGGCLMLIVFGILLFFGIAAFVVKMMRGSEPCEKAIHTAQASEIIRSEIGQPMTLGWLMSGRLTNYNGNGKARLVLPVTGPKGEVSVEVHAEGKNGVWTYSKLTATLRQSGKQVDLLPLLEAHERGPARSSDEEE